MAECIGCGDVVIIVTGGYVIRPQVLRADRHSPGNWPGQAVRSIVHSDDPVRSGGCCTVPFAFVVAQSASSDGAGKIPPLKTQAALGQNQILRCHRICPDLAALVAR